MRKHPRDFWRTFSVNHSRTGAVKLLINTQGRASRLSSSGVPFAGLQPVPGGRNWAAIQPPLQKDDSTLRLAYSALELSPWQCRLTLWEPWTPGPSRRGPAQAFSSIAAMYPVLASATAPAISVRSRLGPNVDGVAAGFKEVSYYHRVTPCGPE